jgi:hypothetical protein
MTIQEQIPTQEQPLGQEETLEREVRAVLSDNPAAITQEVRSLTLRALTEGKLDQGAVQKVVRAVVAGATGGAQGASDGQLALREALQGLDEALAAAAQATRLTLEEAVGNAGAFSRQTLRRRLDDLSTLESLFIETVSQTASSAAGFTRTTLVDVADHARASGSAVGSAVKEGVTSLGRALAESVSDQVEVTTSVLQKEAALLAGLTSGVLQGIADRLNGSHPLVAAEEEGDEQGGSGAQEPPVRS